MSCNLKYILLSLCLLLTSAIHANDTLRLDSMGAVQTFALDGKGHLFVADQEHTLYKLNLQAKELTRVNTKVYGAIYSIDCSNPFEIYVYYKDQNVVVFYDNMLNFRGQLQLNDLGYTNVACVARSFDNQLWVFDQNAFELIKLDKEGNRVASSGNLAAFTSSDLAPFALLESQQAVYLADSTAGILSFDLFGTYERKFYLLGSHCININNRTIYAAIKDQIQTTHTETLATSVLDYRIEFDEFRLQQNQLYLRKGNRIIIPEE